MGHIDYDKTGKVLDSFSIDTFNWSRVILGSIGEIMYDVAYARVRGK